MGYVPLNNYKYDSGYKRIQSGPDHEGYVVLYSGVQSTGPDEGIVVAGAPLSGTITQGAWDYDANWRYVPSTLQTQSGGLDPTPYNVSGALDTYDGVRIYTRNTVAGAQIASAIGPQPGSTVYRPEKYMYYGGAAPDNQNYSPYNTPEINLAAEGKTGGGVTHRTFESSLLTNVLGSQGTSDRSQWRYHQPVYCKTYTETKRSEVPGLMSTPLRAVYRGGSTSYSYNYGGELAANRGGFELYPDDYPPTSVPGSGFCPHPELIRVTDSLSITPSCAGGLVSWYRVDASTGNRLFLTEGSTTYTTVSGDIGYNIATDVACPDPYSSTGYGEPGSACFSSIIRPAPIGGSGTITYPDPVFVTNTISGVASCVGGRISWYRVNPSTGSKSLITQYSSAYTTVSGDIGFAVAAEVECPDPYSPTGFGTPGSAGTTSVIQPPFNPAAYLQFRWVGLLRKQNNFSPACNPLSENYLESAWSSTSSDNYGQLCFAGGESIFIGSFYGGGCREIWVANGEFGITGTGPYLGLNSQNIGYIQTRYSGINYPQNFGAAVGYFACNSVVAQTIGGKWQFTNDPSANFRPPGYVWPDLVEWVGR